MAKKWYEIGSDAQKAVAGITDPAGIFTGLKAAQDAEEQAAKAQEEIDKLGAKPVYSANPALLSYYARNVNDTNNPQGYTAGEKAAFKDNLATTLATQQANAIKTSGGNFSRYIAAALNPGAVRANNEFAANDARLRVGNYNNSMGRLYSAIGQLQNIDDRNTANAYDYRVNTEQRLANSILQQKKYAQDQRDQTGSRALNALGMVYTLGASSALGGNKSNTAPPPSVSYGNYGNNGFIDNTNISGGYPATIQSNSGYQDLNYGYDFNAPYTRRQPTQYPVY